MSNPLVSVIMPAYNAENYIAEAINSVINQTYKELELIIIDDGSTDNTASIINNAAASDSRIKYIYQQNGRQGKARNNGLRNARGQYIAFLDADDLWVHEKLSVQMELMLANKADMIFSESYVFTAKPDFKSKIGIAPGYFKGEKDFIHFLACNRIPILTVLVKQNLVKEVNGFSEESEIQNAEDFHLWLKLFLNGYSFLGITDALTHYRIHATSATANDRHAFLPVLYGLKDLAGRWPQYKPVIAESFFVRINDFLVQNNIEKWEFIKKLLNLRDALAKEKVFVSFWKTIHNVFGKRIFRILFKWKQNMLPAKLANIDFDLLQF